MIERFEPCDAADHRLIPGLGGLLGEFNRAGVITAADIHVARRCTALTGTEDELVAWAIALTVRAIRSGSVCLDLAALIADATNDPDRTADAGTGTVPLPWPDADTCLSAVRASPAVAAGVVRIDEGLIYLDRYWREETTVRDLLVARAEQGSAPIADSPALHAGAVRLFPEGYEEQRAAALAAAGQFTTVLTGGPGTGKTTAVAGLLALVAADAERRGHPIRIALTAPTGKAAARLQQSVEEAQREDRFTDADRSLLTGLQASTVHRLLGSRRDSRTRFRHHRDNRLPHDLIVVDETSMISLTMMARLIEAVRPDARLVFVGDPDQLASVEAGAVLADLVDGFGPRFPGSVAALRTTHRFGHEIAELAQALRSGDDDQVIEVLDGSQTAEGAVRWLDPADPVTGVALRATLLGQAQRVRAAALAGDAAAALNACEEHRMLCAHRDGRWGVRHWNRQVEQWLADVEGVGLGAGTSAEWYPGRPVLIGANDYGLGLYNGDTGVVVASRSGSPVVEIGDATASRRFAPSRLAHVETLHAMTVHKSQGSQARAVTVLLPPQDSPLLTRELLYTAVTRAKEQVTVIGSEAAVRAAVTRRAVRASGLRQRF